VAKMNKQRSTKLHTED